MAKKKKAVKEDVLPWQVYSKNDPTLAKYKPYSVLFGERKFARPFVSPMPIHPIEIYCLPPSNDLLMQRQHTTRAVQ